MKLFTKIVNSRMPFTIIVKSSVSHAWQGSEGFEYVLENTF